MFGHDEQQTAHDNGDSGTPVAAPDAHAPSPVADSAMPSAPTFDSSAPGASTDAPTTPAGDNTDALLSIKQDALKQLSPLVSHLDQSPEEKFRTTMMMIQASDDQNLIKDAYEAAQNITDEKARAQALLDIVNEINYFTQHNA